MVNNRFWLGILVILLVFVMTVVGCDMLEDEPDKESEIIWNGHRYVLYNTGEKSWTAANDYCKSKGGHLATITSQIEQDVVYNLAKGGNKNLYWIGGKKSDGNWVWVTGEQWKYTNWAPGEPNSDGNENYIQMYRENVGDNNAGSWNDEDNSGNSWDGFHSLADTGFICEWD